MTVISYEQVLKDIEELSNKNPAGFTTKDLVKATGRSKTWCRDKIGSLIESGKLKFNGRKAVDRIDMTKTYVPVYVAVARPPAEYKPEYKTT